MENTPRGVVENAVPGIASSRLQSAVAIAPVLKNECRRL